MDKISVDEVFTRARIICKNRSPKATFLFDYTVSRRIRKYLDLCHGYLRWVDDIVDDPERSFAEKEGFINHQKHLIKSYQNNFEEAPNTIEEYFLYYFMEFSLHDNLGILIHDVFNMIDTISWDVDRLQNNGVFSEEKLDDYINLQTQSINNIICYFTNEIDLQKFNNKNIGISSANANVFMLRDLEEDIDAGFINISKEDLENYQIDINNIKYDKNLNFWIKDQIKLIVDALYLESKKLKPVPFGMRISHFYVDFYYLPKIIRYKVYGCFLGSFNKKSVTKEILTFWQSFQIVIKLFNNIFIKTS